jgi:hypothetical protein
MPEEWGEPSVRPSPAELEAGRARVREMEVTRRFRMQMLATCVACLCAAIVLLGITGAIFQGHQASVEQERVKAVACVQAGGTWVENSSSHFECRRG